ncbi:hypothetical protein GDO78_016304 [Eleutherodactylus coqui]|uniref:Taste receptor type 2 member 40 n=1 Tax=Eleutherodactylus coqui TaxID=57060 RepID=A0A8J6B1U0_ELECQ|nr:hypothetical protein GDO78_016304 [Eleutherodactylus coqui]
MIHSFIIGVNVTDWWKGRSVTPVDYIVSSLGISRICAQCIITLYAFLTRVLKLDSPITKVVGTVYAFFAYANVWITSLLSIVFCLKISNFHIRLFLYLRGMIIHRTVYFIVATVLLSTISCLMSLMKAITDETKDRTNNITISNLYRHCNYSKTFYNHIFAGFFPKLFYIISSALLFTSLYHHTAKMKMSSNLSINLETYYSVMKYVSCTFIYSMIYFLGHFVCTFYYFFH